MMILRFKSNDEHEALLKKVKKMHEALDEIQDCLESATDEVEYRKRFDDDDDMRYRSRYGYGRRY